MSTIKWASPITGSWNDATKWSGHVPAAADDVVIDGAGAFTVSATAGDVAHSLTFNAAKAKLVETAASSLQVTGAFDLMAGTVSLAAANTFGSVAISGGVLQLGNANALGAATLGMSGGELTGTASETLGNSVRLAGSACILDAVTGKSLELKSKTLVVDASQFLALQFGSGLRQGAVVFDPLSVTIGHAGNYSVEVAGGTLRASGGSLGTLLKDSASDTVAKGATLDLGGANALSPMLTNAGTITNSANQIATLSVEQASASTGAITGNLALKVVNGDLILAGANSFTGGTTIAAGAALQLGLAESAGSIVGAIHDWGELIVQNPGATTVAGAISGAGSVLQGGPGVTTLGGANSYTGGTTLSRGEIIATNAKSLGAGDITLYTGEILASASMTLAQNAADSLTFNGAATLAATHGTTLTFGGASLSINTATLVFGEGANDGTVVFKAGDNASDPGSFAMVVNAGALKVGDAYLNAISADATSLAVAAGATVDLAGFTMSGPLTGAGVVTNSKAGVAAFVDYGGAFSGAITGRTHLYVNGDVTLTGANTFVGGTEILAGHSLQIGAGGRLPGNVDDRGALVIAETGKVSLSGVISDAGTLTQSGAGSTTLGGANSYTGGTMITGGRLIATNGQALGTGQIIMTGGELLASTSQTQSHDLTTGGTVTFAAAHGTTLTLANSRHTLNAGKIYFGDSGNDGTVIYDTAVGGVNVQDPAHTTLEVRAGTLTAGPGNSGLASLLNNTASTQVDKGAILDAAGHSLSFALTGAGSLTNTSSGSILQLGGLTNFSGVISGAFAEVDLFGGTVLSGAETFAGTAVVEGARVTLSGLFGEDVLFRQGGDLVLTTPSRFTGAIEGFASGAFIDLRNIKSGGAGEGVTFAYDTADHGLTVSDGTHTDHLSFAGSYSVGNFTAMADGLGGATIGWQAAPAASTAPTHRFASTMAAFPSPSIGASAGASVIDRATALLATPEPHAA